MEKTRFKYRPGKSLEVEGRFTITGIDGKVFETGEKVFLCRCGASLKKPFCDGTHRSIGFNK